MADQHQHITPTPELIRQYLEGKLDDRTMHALEKQALNDPFLAEALEGYAQHPADQRAAISTLQSRLEERIKPRARRMDYRWLAAASVLLLICVTAVIMIRQSGTEKENIAQVRHIEAADTVKEQAPAKEQAPPEHIDVAKQANEQPLTQLDVASRQTKRSADTLNAGGQSDELRAEESVRKTETQAIAAAPPLAAKEAKRSTDTSIIFSNGNLNTNKRSANITLRESESALNEVEVSDVGARSRSRVPAPVDGYEAFLAYLAENKIASIKEDSVILTFTVMPDSTLRNFRVQQSPCDTCGKAAIRIITEGPKWAPAPVKKKVRLSVPVGKR